MTFQELSLGGERERESVCVCGAGVDVVVVGVVYLVALECLDFGSIGRWTCQQLPLLKKYKKIST